MDEKILDREGGVLILSQSVMNGLVGLDMVPLTLPLPLLSKEVAVVKRRVALDIGAEPDANANEDTTWLVASGAPAA